MPPLDLANEDTKKEVDSIVEARLKELGVDGHAKDVITRLNTESKSHREARETAEKTANDLKQKTDALDKELATMKSGDDKRKKEIEDEKKRLEDEKKTGEQLLKERIDGIEKTFNDSLTKRDADHKKELKRLSDELSARDNALIQEAVRTAAVKRGIIDEDLVKLFDVAEIKAENGRVDRDAVEKLLDVLVETKPTYFKPADEEKRDEVGRFQRPDPKRTAGQNVDASKIPDADFDAMTARFRSGKV